MKGKVKTRIRETLTSIVKTRQWLMDNGYGANDVERTNAITKIRKILDHYEQKDDSAHVKLVVHLQREIRKIMPGMNSRNKTLRARVLAMLQWCEEKYGAADSFPKAQNFRQA